MSRNSEDLDITRRHVESTRQRVSELEDVPTEYSVAAERELQRQEYMLEFVEAMQTDAEPDFDGILYSPPMLIRRDAERRLEEIGAAYERGTPVYMPRFRRRSRRAREAFAPIMYLFLTRQIDLVPTRYLFFFERKAMIPAQH